MPIYRPNVAFILRNPAGEILLGERRDRTGCWQFPQGGREEGESLIASAEREVEEELGLSPETYRIVSQKGPYRYLFPANKKKRGFEGQEQHYLLADLIKPDAIIRLDEADEFQQIRWIAPASYDLNWIAPMKREVYRQVFEDFFGLQLDAPDGIFC